MIFNKTLPEWKKEHPLLSEILELKEVLWRNPDLLPFEEAMQKIPLREKDVADADKRLERFAPYLAKVFPETLDGIIESTIIEIPVFQSHLENMFEIEIPGKLLLKCDNTLPIAGSIKARGGIYEILKHAEDLAIERRILEISDNYSIIDSDEFRKFYSGYSIVVGSTGNLGLSIGIMSAKLGFKVTVHMSSDAKQWKKDLLRSKGVTVIEHQSDYSEAVKIGRKQSEADLNSYFVDDENSVNLFLGYAVAAARLKKQLDELNIIVDQEHPLFVYLPCGVGGAPGGITFGLKLIFKDDVHCFFAEPTHSPCMLLGLMTRLHDRISVQDFGLDNKTDADGLAVGRPSGFVGKLIENFISGVYTIEDSKLYKLLSTLADTEGKYLEPSALAGVYGPVKLAKGGMGKNIENATHILWATGGNLVPKEIMEYYYQIGMRK